MCHGDSRDSSVVWCRRGKRPRDGCAVLEGHSPQLHGAPHVNRPQLKALAFLNKLVGSDESGIPQAVEDRAGVGDSPVKVRKVGFGSSNPELSELERTFKNVQSSQACRTRLGFSTREMVAGASSPGLSLAGYGYIPGLRRHREV